MEQHLPAGPFFFTHIIPAATEKLSDSLTSDAAVDRPV